MKFVYKPEGLPPKEWPFEPGKLMSPECMVVEKLTGVEWPEASQRAIKGNTGARHAFLYVMLKRENPTLTPKQVAFAFDEVDFVADDVEVRTTLEHFRDLPDDELSDVERAAVAALRDEYPHVAAVVDGNAADDDETEDELDDETEGAPPLPKE